MPEPPPLNGLSEPRSVWTARHAVELVFIPPLVWYRRSAPENVQLGFSQVWQPTEDFKQPPAVGTGFATGVRESVGDAARCAQPALASTSAHRNPTSRDALGQINRKSRI